MPERVTNNAIKLLTTALLASGLFLLSFAARAAIVSGYSDTLTRMSTSTASDHTILFVTPTGVQTSVDTITLDFDSTAVPTFTMGSVSFDDIDLAVDTTGDTTDCIGPFTDKSLAATPAAGVWGAGIAGNVLTLTPPTDAALGEIPAGDCVQIQIGTNAGGADQITNPTSGGSYALALAGAFGDTGTAYIPMLDSDQVAVSATVGSSGGGGGSPPPPPPPVAPIISNVQSINITETTADITWTTDVAATSDVDYGATVSYGSTANTSGTTFAHTVGLSGLTPGALYHFQVRSTGLGTPEATSGDFTFTTLDTTAPVISNIQAINTTGTTVTITWDTDEDSDSLVEYDTVSGPPYGNSAQSSVMTNAHSIDLASLAPNTIYRFRVTSVDASTNSSTSIEMTFQTLDTVAPTISNIQIIDITETSATVTWATDELADSLVNYGLTTVYDQSVSEAAFIANHSVDLASLVSGTDYHFQIVSKDAATNAATSTDQIFTTLADTTPPANASSFTASSGDGQITLTWDNPLDADFAGVQIQRSTTASPTTPSEGTTVFDGATTTYLDTGLTNGTEYFYTAFAYDSSGNFASGAIASATPADGIPPGVVTNLTIAPGDSQNLLDWTNPVDPDLFHVQIQSSTTAFPADPSSGTTVFIGLGTNYLDTGLTNGTTYFYTVFTHDTSLNYSTGVQASGTPFASGPVCGDGLCQAPEDNATCAADCPSVPTCGDSICEAPETNATCPSDCPTVPICGDLICEAPETNATCPTDCAPPPLPPDVCGNGICEASEDSATCPTDCPPPPPPSVVCGDNVCEGSENSTNCPTDCPPPPPEGGIDPSIIQLFTLQRRLQLTRDSSGGYHSLPSRTLTVFVPGDRVRKKVSSMNLNMLGGAFLMQATDGLSQGFFKQLAGFIVPVARAQAVNSDYAADLTIPPEIGNYPGTVILNYDDNTSDMVNLTLIVEPYGFIYETAGGSQDRVSGARVALQEKVGGVWTTWDGNNYVQQNPVVTTSQGIFGYMVPNGTYRVRVTKNDYRDIETAPINETLNIINPELELIRKPKTITEVIIPGAPLTENIFNVTKNISEQTTYITKIIQKEIIEDPRVEKATTQVVVPAAAVVTTVVVATSVQAASFLSYLYFLLTQPILLIGRRKRKEYGTVYNALSKLPVDLAIVRLYRMDGKLVRTLVTDKQGRYAFLVEPGEYKIQASKPRFLFPSEYLKGRKEDTKFLDLYHGEMIQVSSEGAIITANIPMDPIEIQKSNRRIILDLFLRRAQNSMAILSVVLTGIALLLYRRPYLAVIFVVQIGLYFLFRRLAKPKQPKNWGIVYDKETQKPISYAVTRIIETEYNKVLESRVTDSQGRYNFLVGNSKYIISVEKPGYSTEKTAEIDLTKEKEGESVVSVDIGISKASSTGVTTSAPKPVDTPITPESTDAQATPETKPSEKPGERTEYGTERSDESELKQLYQEKIEKKENDEESGSPS